MVTKVRIIATGSHRNRTPQVHPLHNANHPPITCGREKISFGGADIYGGLHKNLNYKVYFNREVTTKIFILNLSPLCKIAYSDSKVIIRKLD